MKHQTAFTRLCRAIATSFCIAAVVSPQSVRACAGSGGTICVINPGACAKSMVLTKAVPMVVVFPPGGPAMFSVPINLFITCPTNNNCGNPCPNSGAGQPLVPASITVNLYPGPPCPPAGPLPPPTATATISTAAGTMAAPMCSSAGTFNPYVVPITVPAGTPPGLYCVIGTASVTFPGGMVLMQTGDTVVCLVEQAPGRPGVPRLSLELLSPSFPRMAPGDQAVARYRVVNNDPSNAVQLTAFATSRQAAVRPQGGNEAQGVFTISSPFGDDFPIMFNPGTSCIPLPEHPFTQREIATDFPVLGPGQSNVITVGIRSYGQCASGSCSESTLRVEGTFSDGKPALACAGMALLVDTSVPSQNCGREVNDCNQNGIPDALDIASRRSADQNFNAMPDECEEVITVPFFSSVTPSNPPPGAPIQVQVAFNEAVPMQAVWANGIPLVRTQFFGAPLWMGTIPADTRPGPQTVYFLGGDALGGIATYIALYNVQRPPAQVDFAALAVTVSPASGGMYEVRPQVGLTVSPRTTATAPLDFAIFVNGVLRHDGRGMHNVGGPALCEGPGCAGQCVVTLNGRTVEGTCAERGTDCFCNANTSLDPVRLALSPGDVVQVVLDPDKTVPELDEGNNEATADVPPRVVIANFEPRGGGDGTLITINGIGFGNCPDNLCAIAIGPGRRFIDIEVLTATPTQLVARLGVVPPELVGVALEIGVGVGQGGRVALCPEFRDVEIGPNTWTWRGDAANMAVAEQRFIAGEIIPAGVPVARLCNFHSGPPMGGTLMVILNKDWGVGSRYCIGARVHAAGTGGDTRLDTVTFTGVGNRFACARRICDLLEQAFRNHPSRPLPVVCTVTTNGANAKITLSLATGAQIDGGNIDIIQKSPPPIVTGLWDIHNRGIWRKEVRKHEIARWYRHYEWITRNSIWFERRAEGVWITREALEKFTCQSHCIYRYPNGRVWLIWRTFTRTDLRRFWVHHRFYWPGRANALAAEANPEARRMAMTMDDVQIVLPMTPQDPDPATPVNEGVMIMDENGQQHFQGEPGFEVMPDIAANPDGFQLAGTALSTAELPPAADRIRDLPMQPMPGMAQLQPGVIIQWLVDANGNVLVDHNQDGWPDPITSPHVLGAQKHQGLIAPPTGQADSALPVDQGNNQLQLFCWELDENGEVLGAQPGQVVIGPPADLDGDGAADGPIGAPAPMDPTVREVVATPNGIQEMRDPEAQPVEIAVIEEGPPTAAQLQAFNERIAAQIPGFVPIRPPLTLCISRIHVRRIWGIDRRFVFDTWLHHWIWHHRTHIILRHRACRVWLTKVSLSHFHSSHHHHVFGRPPSWTMYDLTQVRFFRVCFRLVAIRPNEVAVKIDQMHVVVPVDPSNPNSPLMLLSTVGDENRLFQEVPPAVLAGLQPDPLPVGPDGVLVEPIDPAATLDIGIGGTGVLMNRPLEARGMAPAMLLANGEDPAAPHNNQIQLYCWALNANGTIATETFTTGGPGAGAAGAPITLAQGTTPAIPSFVDENGNVMDNPTMFVSTLTGEDNEIKIIVLPSGREAVLTWEGFGHLEAASQVTGPWIDVPGGATSPATVDLSTGMRFFRVHR